jgi:hypothetical protein
MVRVLVTKCVMSRRAGVGDGMKQTTGSIACSTFSLENMASFHEASLYMPEDKCGI